MPYLSIFNDGPLAETANGPEPSRGKLENLPELELIYLFNLSVHNCDVCCILEEQPFKSQITHDVGADSG